ncbi:MAG: nucleotidyltransferase domain-containing protein [Anaerolineae bacterium]|nr:nucleotidyltransferase domain-containing protein [Anaerolineae bacterium]
MRLTQEQILSIFEVVYSQAGDDVVIYVFGSRLNDQVKGGDVDLLIETNEPLTLLDRACIKMKLERKLSLQVDIVTQTSYLAPTPFQQIARAQAVRLRAPL